MIGSSSTTGRTSWSGARAPRAIVGAVFVIGCAVSAGAQPEWTPSAATEPALVSQVEVRRTEYDVPHITAENLAALGFGLAYCQLEDYGERVAMGLIRARGELGLHFGPDSIESDFFFRRRYRRALETYHLLSQDARDLYEGFAAGVNWYIQLHPDEFPEWMEPRFTGHDVHGRFILASNPNAAQQVLDRLSSTTGSNAWALAPSRTKSGKAILLRNPHLSWNAGYYEAHLIIPGRLNFYGDVRIGYPLFYIGGFNEHLGWATTNNGPDLDEIYALDVDPERPDHYLFDGGSVPLDREAITVEFKSGPGLARETREFWQTPLGPVVQRAGGKIYVLRSAVEGEFRMVDQYLRMMQARNLEEWRDAMRMRAHPSSNFTYADGDGNIFYLWNARLPRRPHEPGGDTTVVPARRSSDIWVELVPFDSLPQLRNPRGGYLHNENDPFHYANLHEPFDTVRYSTNYPRPLLGLRSQLSLDLIHETDGLLSLEEVIELKHTARMLLADRVKADLVAAVRRSTPSDEVLAAIDLIEQWDNTTRVDAQGGVLFETWFMQYLTGDQPLNSQTFPDAWRQAFAVPWSAEDPVGTPRGLGDPERAVEAFAWAVEETKRKWGRWDIAWGEVHRVRRGDVDVPVGGCRGWLGCIRSLVFTEDEDGKRVVVAGDAWVLAVEFGDPPRAYSVLGYGQSAREDSPHYSDQAELFATGRLKKVAFTEADIEAGTIHRYRPGREAAAGR